MLSHGDPFGPVLGKDTLAEYLDTTATEFQAIRANPSPEESAALLARALKSALLIQAATAFDFKNWNQRKVEGLVKFLQKGSPDHQADYDDMRRFCELAIWCQSKGMSRVNATNKLKACTFLAQPSPLAAPSAERYADGASAKLQPSLHLKDESKALRDEVIRKLRDLVKHLAQPRSP